MGRKDLKLRQRQRQRRRRRLLLAAAAVMIWIFFGTRLTDISVTGNRYLPPELVTEQLFSSWTDRLYYYARWKDAFRKKKELPMLQSYELEFDGHHHVTVAVTENEVIGGIRYMDTYLYFDRQGYILCSLRKALEGVPLVNGLNFGKLGIYQQVTTDREEVFDEILRVAAVAKNCGMTAKSLNYGVNRWITVDLGDIRVCLGTADYAEEKFSELMAILGGLEGMRGTLHLENFEPGVAGSYNFQPD